MINPSLPTPPGRGERSPLLLMVVAGNDDGNQRAHIAHPVEKQGRYCRSMKCTSWRHSRYVGIRGVEVSSIHSWYNFAYEFGDRGPSRSCHGCEPRHRPCGCAGACQGRRPAFAVDLMAEGGIAKLSAEIDKLGALDMMVHNLGGSAMVFPGLAAPTDDWKKVWQFNVGVG